MGTVFPLEVGAFALLLVGGVSSTWKRAINGNNKQWFSALPAPSDHVESLKIPAMGPHAQRSSLNRCGVLPVLQTIESFLGDYDVSVPQVETTAQTDSLIGDCGNVQSQGRIARTKIHSLRRGGGETGR